MKKKKALSFALMAVFAVGFVVAAGYVVNHFVIQSDVYEPLEVSYAILGDGGNYEGTPTCNEYAGQEGAVWMVYDDENPVDVQGLYAGEARKFCVKIDNAGEGNIPYTIESKIQTGHGNYNDCAVAFPETTKTGTVDGLSTKIDGQLIEVPANAPPVNDCLLEISVSRG